jgi:hypothetical protein
MQNLSLSDIPCTSELAPGQLVVPIVSDDDIGMGSEILNNIFDPFNTSNGPGFSGSEKATVLGLCCVLYSQ